MTNKRFLNLESISNFGHTYSFIKCSLFKQCSLERRLICFIKKCLSSSNSIVNVISNVAICNLKSAAGKNDRSVLDANGD